MTFTHSPNPEARVCQWVEQVTDGTESCLEFGAGLFTYIKAARSKRKAGIEAFEPYCQAAIEDPGCSDINVYFGDMRHFQLLTFDDFEVALFVDSIEHIKKADALQLLHLCKLRFKTIAIFTPQGPHENPVYDGNDMQAHLSTWEASDLEDLGFTVIVEPHFHHTNPPEKQAAMFAVWRKHWHKTVEAQMTDPNRREFEEALTQLCGAVASGTLTMEKNRFANVMRLYEASRLPAASGEAAPAFQKESEP